MTACTFIYHPAITWHHGRSRSTGFLEAMVKARALLSTLLIRLFFFQKRNRNSLHQDENIYLCLRFLCIHICICTGTHISMLKTMWEWWDSSFSYRPSMCSSNGDECPKVLRDLQFQIAAISDVSEEFFYNSCVISMPFLLTSHSVTSKWIKRGNNNDVYGCRARSWCK